MARKIYKVIPEAYRSAYDAGRVLFLAEETATAARVSRVAAQSRNAYIATLCDELVFTSVTPESSLHPLTKTQNPTKHL